MILIVSSGAASTMRRLTENSFPSAPTIVARSTAKRSGKNTQNQKSKSLFFCHLIDYAIVITIPVLIRCILNCSEKILLLFIHLKDYEGNPLSPPEGEAAQGVHPPDPLFVHLSRVKRESLVDLMRAIAFFMTAPVEAETKVSETPKGLIIIFQGFLQNP